MSDGRVPFLAQFIERLAPADAARSEVPTTLGTQTQTRAREEHDADASNTRSFDEHGARTTARSAALGTHTITKMREDGDVDAVHASDLPTLVRGRVSAGTSTMSAAKEEPDTDQERPMFRAPAWGAAIL